MASRAGIESRQGDEPGIDYAEAELRIHKARSNNDPRLDLRDLRHLTTLPEVILDLDCLRSLQFSALSMNSFPQLIGELATLESLTVLNFRQSSFPEQIARLKDLRELVWFEDGVGTPAMPDWIGSLRRLRRILLSMPSIAELPSTLGNLTELRWLGLDTPRLEMLPSELGGLQYLRDIRLHDTAFRDLHPEVVQQGSAAILAFLRAQAADVLVPQWWSRLLIVGEATVGKTSLAKHLAGRRFDPNEGQTHGVHIEALRIAHPQDANTTMNLNLWDFGGQLEYRATQRLYLTDRALFLLVWNARARWQDGKLAAWLDVIKARAPHSPVLVVGTHCDSASPACLPDDLRTRYPQIVGTLDVDSYTFRGIPELQAVIQQQAARLPLMGTKWPASWITAADAIRELSGYSMPASKVWQTMRAKGVADPQDQQIIARALHDLGDIVYFADDRELSKKIILRPSWLDAKITAVLDSPSVAQRHGVLTRAERDRIWSDLEDPDLSDRLLRMMERFDLAYRIGDADASDEVALVVERLGDARPAGIDERWREAAQQPGIREIGIAYRLKSRQAGVPTWFIARQHRYTTGLHWTYGALLRDRDPSLPAWALLADDGREQPTVSLRVRGLFPVRFLSVLAEAFEEILEQRYPGLIEQRLVLCACAEEPGERCEHLFPLNELILAATDNDLGADRRVRCPRSRTKVDARVMLDGLRGSPYEAKITGMLEELAGQKSTLARIEQDGLAALKGVRVLLADRSNVGVHCPSLFALEDDGRTRVLRRRAFKVRLWCEWPYGPNGPHPLPGDSGTYVLNQMPGWLRDYLPYLARLVSLLGAAVPLAAPALSAAGVHLSDQVKAGLETAADLVGDLGRLTGPRGPADLLPGAGHEPLHYAEVGADFRALRAALRELDPAEVWGGLSPVPRPEDRRIVYLCREHIRELEYPYRAERRSS